MNRQMVSRRAMLAGCLGAPSLLHAQAAKAPVLSDDEKATFLLSAKVLKTRMASRGITGTYRATLTDGKLTHDASIQSVNESKPVYTTTMGTEINFRDSWKYNVAAYRLDRMLGLRMVPVSVARKHKNDDACYSWWVDNVLMVEGDRMKKKIEPPNVDDWNQQMAIVRVFDQLIFNTDRNVGNLVIDKKWQLWMIDHTRAFRVHKELKEEKNLTRCDRALLAALKGLKETDVRESLSAYLTSFEMQGLMERRDKIVEHFEKAGESVLYDSPRRQS